MDSHHYVVIIAGGSGTRLWPVSRRSRPKHLQKIIADRSLLQQTYERVLKIVPKSQIYISTACDQAKEILKQIPISKDRLIVETALRNTAPAIGLAGFHLYKQDKKAIVATIASDHLVQKEDEFAKIIKRGFKLIEKNLDYLLTMGIRPARPETGFGYIELGKSHPETKSDIQVFYAKSFKEKPDLKTAEKYLLSGNYLWNASYFIFKGESLRGWYKKFIPKIYKILEKITPDNIEKLYPQIKSEPFDTAVAERLDKILVIPAEIGWSDVGSWQAVHEILSEISGQHSVVQGEHIDIGSEGILIYSHEKFIATAGLKDVVVVDTSDALLVIDKNRAQDVKKIVEKLKELKKEKYL